MMRHAAAACAVFVLAGATRAENTTSARAKLTERLHAGFTASMRETRASLSALEPGGGAEVTSAVAHNRTSYHHTRTARAHNNSHVTTVGAFVPFKPVLVVLGGSNTLGARSVTGGEAWKSFAVQLSTRMADNYTTVKHAQGAMGPIMAAACANSFIPPATRLVTIEFLPNMGYTGDDLSELGAIETLLQVAQQRRARVVVVLINPGRERFAQISCTDDTVGCTTTDHVHRIREGIVNLTLKYRSRYGPGCAYRFLLLVPLIF